MNGSSSALTEMPDYNNLYYWAAHPDKKDLSDSIPRDLQKKEEHTRPDADVFFIHPTTYLNKGFNQWNASLLDEALNTKTDESAILYQASVFNRSCRVFAPRYRQAHIKTFYIPDSTAKVYFDLAYADVKAAFEIYLREYHRGRPIIIAAHSQGTLHAGRLLKEFFENKPLKDKLVCAYIIGMPIPDTYFTSLPPCSDSSATGCFVGWRTYKRGYVPEKIKNEPFRAVVVNPLTWSMQEEKAPSRMNKGGILQKFNKVVPGVVNANVHQNVLWTSKPDMPGKLFLVKKDYHIGDINLFYVNIRENVALRVNEYVNQKKD